MRILILFFSIFSVFTSIVLPQKGAAQITNDTIYEYNDNNTGVIYYISFSKSDAETIVKMRTNIQTQWTDYRIIADENTITTVTNGKVVLHLKINPEKKNELLLYTFDFKKSWTYKNLVSKP